METTVRPFTIYRIICTITGKALVSGSDNPHSHRCPPGFPNQSGQWYERGQWGRSSAQFWRTKDGVKKHLMNLCHDWGRESFTWRDYLGRELYDSRPKRITGAP